VKRYAQFEGCVSPRAVSIVMTPHLRISIAAVTLVCIAVCVGQAGSHDKPQSIGEVLESAQVITILRNEQLRESEPDRVTKAIEKLGDMRSIVAIADLVKVLTFKRTFPWEIEASM
jgi:hypothetical protein